MVTTEMVGHSPRTIVPPKTSVVSLANVVNGGMVVMIVYQPIRLFSDSLELGRTHNIWPICRRMVLQFFERRLFINIHGIVHCRSKRRS